MDKQDLQAQFAEAGYIAIDPEFLSGAGLNGGGWQRIKAILSKI